MMRLIIWVYDRHSRARKHYSGSLIARFLRLQFNCEIGVWITSVQNEVAIEKSGATKVTSWHPHLAARAYRVAIIFAHLFLIISISRLTLRYKPKFHRWWGGCLHEGLMRLVLSKWHPSVLPSAANRDSTHLCRTRHKLVRDSLRM